MSSAEGGVPGSGARLESRIRPLTAAERRLLQMKIHHLRSRGRRGRRVLILGAVVIAILWVLTLVASGAPWPVVTGFWVVVGAAILLWLRHDLEKNRRGLHDVAQAYESADRRNEAEVFHIAARSYAEFEEVEDEGACYAFELHDERIVFVTGQQFYPEARFPSHDFSLVHILGEERAPVDMVIEKRGPKVIATRTVPAATKLKLAIPEHLQVIDGSLGDLEAILGSCVEGVNG